MRSRGIRPPIDPSSGPPDSSQLSENGEPPRKPGVLTIVSQSLLLLFTIACSVMGLYWLTTDTSGEYFGSTPDLGSLNLSVIRRATSYDGELTIANRSTFKLTESQIHGANLSLVFQSEVPNDTQTLRFKGRLKDDTLAGILELPQSSVNLTLMRDPLASLFRQFQSHIPYVTITSPSKSTLPRGSAFQGYFDYILNKSWPEIHPSGKPKK